MKIQSEYRGIKEFLTVCDRAARYRHMIAKTTQKRNGILIHWYKRGIASAIDAFSLSRRTLFCWKGLLDKGGGKIEALNPKKREPKQKRKRLRNDRILEEIKRLREKHPDLGKEKLYPSLLDFRSNKAPQTNDCGQINQRPGRTSNIPSKSRSFRQNQEA